MYIGGPSYVFPIDCFWGFPVSVSRYLCPGALLGFHLLYCLSFVCLGETRWFDDSIL